MSEGAKVLTLSDSDGFVYEPSGFNNEQLDIVREIKKVKRGRIAEYAQVRLPAYFFSCFFAFVFSYIFTFFLFLFLFRFRFLFLFLFRSLVLCSLAFVAQD